MSRLKSVAQKAYAHYQDDLHYQASMYESSFGDGYNEGRNKGRVEGKAEGKVEEKEQMVLNSYRSGLELTMISQITQLSIDKVKEIINANGL